jgi:hypothetical protein
VLLSRKHLSGLKRLRALAYLVAYIMARAFVRRDPLPMALKRLTGLVNGLSASLGRPPTLGACGEGGPRVA